MGADPTKALTFAIERSEMEAVLGSQLFGAGTTRHKLLRYICEQYFESKADQVKEYNLAIDVLGKSPDFDKKQSSVVRVEAYRLRKKLLEYYADEGKDHPIQIRMSPGKYTVRFAPREEAAVQEPEPELEIEATEQGTPRRGWPSLTVQVWRWGAAVFFVLVLIIGGWGVLRRHAQTTPAPVSSVTPPQRDAPGVSPAEPLRFLVGLNSSKYIDGLGRTWGPDQHFSGGTITEVPLRGITRSSDPMLYLKPRTGEFRYDIPLQPGSYELRLFFAETVYRDDELMQNGGEASRLFNVLANGRLILQEFDVISDAGGPNIADIRVFRDIVPAADGYLHLEFKGSALLNGIEIAPGKSGRMLPVRIAAARQTGFTDSAGNYWQPDQFWQGGRSVLRSQPKADPDPEVYSGERFGHFSYAIPVDPRGSYTLTLRFAEFFWGPGGNSNAWPYHPGVHVAGIPGGAGSRTFDLLCNTRLLMKDFDIYREAGGRLIGITRTFRGLRPSVQGKLTLSFLPVNCYATVCAIEVLDEAN